MKYWKVYFGHVNSVGLEVIAPTEKEAKIRAIDTIRENRGDTKWSGRHYVDWEKRIGEVVYTLNDRSEAVLIKDGEALYAGPPVARDFGAFPPIVKVELLS